MRKNLVGNTKSLYVSQKVGHIRCRTRVILFSREIRGIHIITRTWGTRNASNHSTGIGERFISRTCCQTLKKSPTNSICRPSIAVIRRSSTDAIQNASTNELDLPLDSIQHIESFDHESGTKRLETNKGSGYEVKNTFLLEQLPKLLEPFGGNLSHFISRSNNVTPIVSQQIRPESTFEVDPKEALKWLCLLKLPIVGQEHARAVGRSSQKRDAHNIACRNLLRELCRSGHFQRLLLEEDFDVLRTKSVWKLRIFDYAAQFLVTPNFITEKVHGSLSFDHDRYRTTVSISELKLQASMVSSKPLRAEELACKSLLDRLENNSDPLGQPGEQLTTQAILNSSNAIKFFKFYTSKYPDKVVTLESGSPVKGSPIASSKRLIVAGRPKDWANMRTPDHADTTAYLLGALSVCREEPTLLREFHLSTFYTMISNSSRQQVLRMNLDDESVLVMQNALHQGRNLGLRDEKGAIALDPHRKSSSGHYKSMQKSELDIKSRKLLRQFLTSQKDPKYVQNLKQSAALPVMRLQNQVVEHLQSSIFSVVIGETGSGKTTKIPQIILDQSIKEEAGAECNVICTQPRRIAATSVAERVARERGEHIGNSVGYAVRFDSKVPRPGGSITYCTTAILLKRLQTDPDRTLDTYSHFVIDEVHERNTHQDMLLGLLRSHIATRLSLGKPVPKLVLMSATIFPTIFKEYLETLPNGIRMSCPVLHIPGRPFQVQSYYLDDILPQFDAQRGKTCSSIIVRTNAASTRRYLEMERAIGRDVENETAHHADEHFALEAKENDETLVPTDLVVDVITHIAKSTKSGAILVFLPGRAEITDTQDGLENAQLGVDFRDSSKYEIYTLHSEVFTDQQTVFQKSPPNVRKIILSTNLAETSVTIPDVRYVVDSGKVREQHYDQAQRVSQLRCTWISKSSAVQRAGRAGRLSDGYYYALYSKARFESFRSIGIPEILRSDLQNVCLATKAQTLDLPIDKFLGELIEPPSPGVMTEAIDTLKGLQAFTHDGNITALGRLLFNLPLRPYLGKMVVLGVIFRCLEPLVLLAIALEEGRLMYDPVGMRQAAANARSELADDASSDHITRINAVLRLRTIQNNRGTGAAKNYAFDHFIDYGTFKSILNAAADIEKTLVDANLIRSGHTAKADVAQIGDDWVNANSNDYNMIRALAFAVTYPNIGICNGTRWHVRDSGMAIIHPASVNQSVSRSRAKAFEGRRPRGNSVCFFDSMSVTRDGDSFFLRDTSLCSPLLTILFGGTLKASQLADDQAKISVGDWLTWHVKADDFTMRMIVEFRKALDRLLIQSYEELANQQQREFLDHRTASVGDRFVDSELRSTFTTAVIELLKRDKWIPSASLSSPRIPIETLE